MPSEISETSIKRKVTIDYSELEYMGVQELECYVQLFLHRSDGSKLIVLETSPTHNHKPEDLEGS